MKILVNNYNFGVKKLCRHCFSLLSLNESDVIVKSIYSNSWPYGYSSYYSFTCPVCCKENIISENKYKKIKSKLRKRSR